MNEREYSQRMGKRMSAKRPNAISLWRGRHTQPCQR